MRIKSADGSTGIERNCFVTRILGTDNFTNFLQAVLEISLTFFLLLTVLSINSLSERIAAISIDFKTFQNSIKADQEILFHPMKQMRDFYPEEPIAINNFPMGSSGEQLSSLINRFGYLIESRDLMEEGLSFMIFIFTSSGILIIILFIYLVLILIKDSIQVPVLWLLMSLLPLTSVGVLALVRLLVLAESGQKLENSVSSV